MNGNRQDTKTSKEPTNNRQEKSRENLVCTRSCSKGLRSFEHGPPSCSFIGPPHEQRECAVLPERVPFLRTYSAEKEPRSPLPRPLHLRYPKQDMLKAPEAVPYYWKCPQKRKKRKPSRTHELIGKLNASLQEFRLRNMTVVNSTTAARRSPPS